MERLHQIARAVITSTAYTESGHGASVDVTDEEYAIAGVLMNRWEFANKNWYLFAGPVRPGSRPVPVGSYGAGGSNINSIAENPGQFAVYQKNPDGSISLTPSAQRNLNSAANSAAVTSLCDDLAWALTEGYSMWGERNDGDPLYLYNGLILTAFNSLGHAFTKYEQTVGSFGDANTFYGVPESYVSDTIPPPIRRPRPIRPRRRSPPRPPR